jgi:hypothetical protein
MKKVNLKLDTKLNPKVFYWSSLGITFACIWISLNQFQPPNPPNLSIKSPDPGSNSIDVCLEVAAQGIGVGLVGLVLALVACLKYYLRLGIVPGIYHSTVCIPQWQNGDFKFSVSTSLYYCFVASGLFVCLALVFVYSFWNLRPGFAFCLQIAGHSALLALAGNFYLKGMKKVQEIAGIVVIVLTGYLVYLDFEWDLGVEFVVGSLVVLIHLALILVIGQSGRGIDSNSIGILTLIIYGFISFVLLTSIAIIYSSDVLRSLLSLNCLTSSLVFALFIYSFCRCEQGEFPLVICYLCFGVLISADLEMWVRISLLFTACIGLLIFVLGDIPCILFEKCRPERTKSELHSPLLI